MSNSWNKPKSLHDLAEEIANRMDDPKYPNPSDGGAPYHGHDVSNEPRVPKGQPTGGEWTVGGASHQTRRPNRLANSYTPAPFLDDHGERVLDMNGDPMQRPSDVDLRFFVDQGLATAAADIGPVLPGLMELGGLVNFRQRGPWDIQRIGSDVLPTKPFINSANVAIGLYGAAAGVPEEITLEAANQWAKITSHFDPNAAMDPTYRHLREENVYDIQEG